MKNNDIKTRVFWIVGTVICLVICFLLSRYAFFAFHGNKQWPIVILVIALVITGIAAIFDGRKLMICSVVGYIGGFVLSLFLGVVGVDQGGGTINNWWVIWTISFVAIAVIGAVWEIIGKKINKRRN